MRVANPAWTVLVVVSLSTGACGGKTDDGTSPDGGGVADTGGVGVDGGAGTDTGGGGSDGGGPLDTGISPVDGGGVDFTLCSGPGTCVAIPRTCCGVCGSATPEDVVGVETSHSSAYSASVCGPGTGCPACFRPADPFLQAFCRASHCAVVDLHEDARTGCATDDDCQLRYEGCCEKCGAPADGLFALRKDAVASYRAEVCAPDAACPKCAVGYPAGLHAACDSTKHCVVAGGIVPD